MKRVFYFIFWAAMLVTFVACEEDEPAGGDGQNNTTNNPATPVPDPEGTITVSLLNNSSGKTSLDGVFYIDAANNFTSGQFVSAGAVNGLGNVTKIPTKGWSNMVAVVPGNGYVAYDDAYNIFYRIYVESYNLNSFKEIIGANVKYQKPFCPTTSKIKLPRTTITMPFEGGSAGIVFDNTEIIPFSVSSNVGWCWAEPASTLDYPFLVNAVAVYVESNPSSEADEAIVTIADHNGNKQDIKVIRAGVEPYMVVPTGSLYFTPAPDKYELEERFCSILTNYDISELSVSSDADWLEMSIEPNYKSSKQSEKQIRFVGGKEVDFKSAAYSEELYLRITNMEVNTTGKLREAKITLKTTDGKFETVVSAYQESINAGFDYEQMGERTIPGAAGTYDALVFTSYTQVEGLELKSDAEWCVVEQQPEYSYCEYNYNYNCYYYYYTCRFSTSSNAIGTPRVATLLLSNQEGDVLAETKITQKEYEMSLSVEDLSFDRNNSNGTITVIGRDETMQVSCDADWCSWSWNGGACTIRVIANDTGKDRVANLVFSAYGQNLDFVVYQSAYAVGDNYSVDGVEGTVNRLTGQNHGIITKELEGAYQWSTEEVLIGASSTDDGEYNTGIVAAIPNYEELYPAFAAVLALNVDGVTGWYLPAAYELDWDLFPLTSSKTLCTSSESSQQNAWYVCWAGVFSTGYAHGYNDYKPYKNMSRIVVAAHKF